MEEFKTINRTTQVLKIASCLQKLYRKIVESKKKSVDDHNIKELAFLRSQCKAENIHLSLMACQTLVKLVEEDALDLARVLSDLTSLIPNSTPSQYTAITEGIVSLLLLSLKRQVAQNESRQFQNPYGLKNPQHPLIVLIHQDGSNMIDIASKISGICNHNDKEIRMHSIEFLRPVLLYIFCNPQNFPDSKVLWTELLTQSSSKPVAQELITEILTWSKISSPETCLFTSLILLEAIDHYQNQNKFEEMAESYIYLALVVNQLILFGIDPRPSLLRIYRCLHIKSKYTQNSLNVLLVILSKTLHIISPFYLPEILQILFYIIVTMNCGNQYILNMVLDGTIQWMSQTAFIPADGQSLADKIIKKIIAGKGAEDVEQISTAEFSSDVRNFHPDIALSFDIANLAESFEESEYKNIFTFIDTINIKSKLPFCRKMNLFLRSIFLSKEPALDCWFKVYQTILSIVKSSGNVADNLLMTYLYKLASETNPEVQLELLKGLPAFAVSKDNIPMVLNTIKTISTGPNMALAMDLFLRVWKLEVRTYPFLSKLLTPQKKESWSITITKAYTIREICLERPTQYGPDLVKYLSDILNNCSNEDGSLATSIALEAIVALCESNTVNITSTWKALNGKFRHEKRTKVLKSLYKLFGQVPLLPSPTPSYESLVDECLETLWLVITASNDTELINEALKTLVNFKPETIMTLRHIPEKFINPSFVVRNEITHFDHIVGEVWVELLRNIKPACIREAADLISHYISDEISGYRSGTYHLTEGKPEPRKLAGLHAKSVLRAITNYLVIQSRLGDNIPEPAVVTGALRSISKKFSKPIPPLDWCFLHSFFHLSFEARKYCVLIAKNQVLHSGTAKRLLENFLVEFEPNIFETDLLVIFSILPEIANGVSLPILRSFVEKIATYCFRESQLNGFVEGCLFEKFLDSVKSVFLGNVESPEVLSLFTSIAERYIDSIELDSKLFERYTELVSVLHPSSIDGLTSPNNWWEIPVTKLKKATIIRCYLVLYNTQIENPLTWLDPLIDAYANLKEEQIFFFRHLAITLFAYNDDKTACSWLMNLSLKIQGLLSDVANEDRQQKVIFLIDIYILTVVVLSGCAVLLGNLNVAATSPISRNEIFPESLQMLCDQDFWKENEAKIYEFLYHLHKNHPFLKDYADVFRSAIICSRNNVYFDNKSVWINLNVLLVILSKTLHIISPFYLPEILQILFYIIVTMNCGNQYILNMVLDGTIQWMSQTAFIPADGQSLADKIIKKIIAGKGAEDVEQISTAEFSSDVRNFHPDIALSFDIANLAESFEESEYKNIFTFIDTINIKSKLPFCRKMNLFLRSIFLSKEPALDCWFKVYQTILSIVKSSGNVADNLLMTYLYKLASETNPEVQLELLKGLPAFAVSKDNIPMVLNTIKTISTGPNMALAMDLFLRVWKLEVRTYPFLSKLLTPQKKESWSITITKAYTIREICLERPTQYGPDLVKYLSDILNNCSNEDGSLATSIALEAIVALCESNTVNITSTWKALNGKFRHEKRTKVLKSLYKLFGQVPLLPSPTPSYESLVDECLETLWLVITASNDTELINEALKTLVNFKPETIMTLRHIPEKFINPSFVVRNEITHFDHIVGEVWVELLRNIKPACIREAADLISHYISDEISGYRSGTYHLTEGKPEPRKLAGLHAKSVLRAITNYLVIQSRLGDNIPEPAVVTGALRSISKKFSKPIPPLDWCFLHSFFHLSFEARKYCVLIAKNQVLHSGTAKRLLENFLVEFEPNIFETDLLVIFSILPEIANGVSLPILRSFVEKIATYCFRESQLNGFVEGCLFEKFLDSVKSVFLGNVESPEVLSLFTSIAERYIDSIELDSKLFERYTELVSVLHPSSIDGLTSPNNWWEIPVTKLKKATIIRCYLVLYNTQIENPLTWLDPLIDAYANLKEEQIFFFRHLAITLFAYNDDKTACSWLMNLSLKIQGLLSDVANEDRQQKVIFLIDIYILTVVVLSGCAVLLGNLNVAATSPISRNEIFPESLQMLCDQDFWKENEAKIYEFLYHLHKNHPFLKDYADVFRSAIICSRNNVYFDNKSVWINLNVLLVILSKTLHIISPFYLPEILQILFYIIVTMNCGNQYILNMVLDGTIQWMSQTAFIPADGQSLADKIIKKIIAGKGAEDVEQISTAEFSSDVRNFHPDIALSFDIANLAESFEESEYKNIFTFIDTINIKSKLPFCRKMNLFLRSIFLSKEPALDCWFKVYQTILSIVKSSGNVADNLLMTYLYKLASETNPEVQLELLKGLPAFAVSKDNIPMVLNTIKTISTGPNMALAMDLFLRVWKLEVRTYPFLSKLLTPQKKESWSITITKAYTIREICLERPTQYGPDLVKYLSDILNNCSNEDGSLATSIALEAIVALCESNTVNITSTWKALNGKFRHEKRTKVLKSLYKLFGQVPLLPSPTPSYESLVDECLETLWLVITASNDTELINEALKTLVNFKPETIMTLRHIPEKFINPSFVVRNEITHFDHIVGEVWVELLRNIKPACIREAADLISHYISDEISGYRSGTYHLTEGKPEPRKLAGLHAKSVLRAITNYLVIQSRLGDNIPEPAVVTGALRSISKKFSKPIPPLDWCFLHSFFHLSFEARKYCVLIAKNQVLHSGTAKRLLENFLVEFEPNIFETDLLVIFSILPEIANGVSLPILRSFVEKIATYCFRESQLNGFVEGCLFEKFLDSVKSVFLGNVESPEVLSLFTSIAERYIDSIELDSKLFERYTELVSVLHPSSIDGLTSPNNWWEIPVTKLKKATIIRCYLVLYNTQIENPLTWLDPLIDAYANLKEEQIFFFRHLAITLFAYNDDKTACSWLMNLSLKIQGLLSDVANEDRQQKVIFLIDIYILTVVVLSGCAVLLGNLNVAATSPISRNEIFPESLQMLCDQDFWKENEAKIYEFLYHLHKNHPFLKDYADVFRSAIICSRNNVYFDNKSVWIKYVGMRK